MVHHLDEEGVDIAAISKELSSEKNLVVVIGQISTGRILVSMSADIGVDARKVLKAIAAVTGGGGGGKPDFAQGGGADPSKMRNAFKAMEDIVRKALKE